MRTRQTDGNEAKDRVREMLKEAKTLPKELYTLRHTLMELEEKESVTKERWEISLMGREDDPATEAINRLIGQYAKKRGMIAQRLDAIVDRKVKLDTLLEGLPDMHHHIMTLRWTEGKTWDAIARKTYMSARQGQRLQAEAIDMMTRALTEMEKEEAREAAYK